MNEKTAASFPVFADWLSEFAMTAKDPFVRASVDAVTYCMTLEQQLPSQYGWRFSSVESIREQVNAAKSAQEMNRIYWLDFARNVEAYSIMTFWRGVELIKPAVISMNIREIIAPAVLSRSLLELSATFIWNANYIEKSIEALGGAFQLPNTVVASNDLETFIVKAIWGTRVGKPQQYLYQTNVLTPIQKLSKNPDASDLLLNYDYLCDIAHPNVIGNARFWSHVAEVYPDGAEKLMMSRLPDVESIRESIEKILWALCWGSVHLRNGFEIISQSLKFLIQQVR